jgi:histidyl-tRNA synthetase
VSEGAAKKEEKPRKFQAVRGTRDLLPPETALWNRVEQTAHEVFATFGFGEIRLPIFEPTELFARAVGGETDIVSKEMYSFEDHESNELAALRTLLVAKQPSVSDPNFFWSYELKVTEFRERLRLAIEGGDVAKTPENEKVLRDLGPLLDSLAFDRQEYEKSKDASIFERFNLYVGIVRGHLLAVDLGDNLSLRPEATASVCRAYVEHGMQSWPSPVKLYYIGPMFRRERPQKGRYRQFYQIGAEIFGSSDSPRVDADLIEMLMKFFDRVGLKGTTLYINSIGDKECRPRYVELLQVELRKVRDALGEDSRRRIETNPLRVLDSKIPNEQEVIEKLPHISDHLCGDCAKNYEEVKHELRLRGVSYEENWRLVRGLDYYMRTTFEITAPGLGSQNAVCGGGRYDGLVELIGGRKFKSTKATGFAIGEDRLVLALQHLGAGTERRIDVFIAWKDEASRPHAESVARLIRDAGLIVEVPLKPMSPGEGLGLASKLNAPIGIVIGPGEASAKTISLRQLADRDQATFDEEKLGHNEMRRLLTFRILLERELAQLAIVSGIEFKDTAIPVVAERLVRAGLLPGHLKMPIDIAMNTFNSLVHGREVRPEHLSEAIAASVMVLDELSGTSGRTRISLGR